MQVSKLSPEPLVCVVHTGADLDFRTYDISISTTRHRSRRSRLSCADLRATTPLRSSAYSAGLILAPFAVRAREIGRQ